MKRMFQKAVVLCMATSLFAACTPAPTEKTETVDMGKLKTEIQAKEDAFAAAEQANDADAVAAYYSDDAISYGRNKEPAVGKAAIRAKIAEDLANTSAGTKNIYKVVDLFAEGKMAVEIGSFSHLDSAGTEVDKGYYMSYFQNRDGNWLCVRDMNVSTLPAKSPM